MREIYYIPAFRTFLPALAGRLLEETADAPESLAQKLILTPNRRASRALADCFFALKQKSEASKNHYTMIMPMMRALGDQDDEIALFSAPELAQTMMDIPPAMGESERLMLLSAMIANKEKDIHKERVFMLASALAHLMDQIDTENLEFNKLNDLVPDALAEHWQLTLDFLKILGEFWPQIEKEMGKISPAKRRRLLIEKQIALWNKNPPPYEVIIAGSTASVIDVAKMIDCVSQLHHQGGQGRVILPSFDRMMGDSYEAILKEESHHQHNLARLLKFLDCAVEEVKPWPVSPYETNSTKNYKGDPTIRASYIHDALLPAISAHPQSNRKIKPDALGDLAVLALPNIQEEAEYIALKLREVLEIENQNAALITPVRELARRVIAQLQRWNITIDDSAGQSAATTPVGVFLLLISQMMDKGMSLSNMLSLWQHPLFHLRVDGRDLVRSQHLSISRDIEDIFIANQDIGLGLKDFLEIKKTIKAFDVQKKPLIIPFIKSFLEAIEPIKTLYDGALLNSYDFKDWLIAHIKTAETLSGYGVGQAPNKNWLWQQEDGQTISQLLSDYIPHATKLGGIGGIEYHGLIATILRRQVVRPRHGLHPRLHILSPLEARLMDFDVTILGGLNETNWPEDGGGDPFMSRPMRHDFGLPGLERKIGLQAHDFYSHFHQRRVILTFSKRVGNAPAIPSRWIERLGLTAQKMGFSLDDLVKQEQKYVDWMGDLNLPANGKLGEPHFSSRPTPMPKRDMRPSKLSVTNIRLLRENPYHIYAKYILNLWERNELNPEPDHAQKGILIHNILEQYFANLQNPAEFNLRNLLDEGEKQFLAIKENYPEYHAHYWPRFLEACNFLKELKDKEIFGHVKKYYTEIKGKAQLTLNEGEIFMLEGRVDRLDLLENNGIVINDYKSGTTPSESAMKRGDDPQMILLALIMEKNGFLDLDDSQSQPKSYSPLAIQIIDVGGKDDAKPIYVDLMDEKNKGLLEVTEKSLLELLNHYFTRDDTKFKANIPKQMSYKSPYDHLSRSDEWGRVGANSYDDGGARK